MSPVYPSFLQNSAKVVSILIIFIHLGTQETLRQVFMTITKKNSIPIKLWIESVDEMK